MNDVASLALVPLTQEAAPLRRKIVAALRHAIEVGELKPGERLVEKELCQKLNVSRPSLREALRQLQSEKLVSAVPRGLVVAAITEQDAANIYRVRAALEGLVAEQFVENATEIDIDALQTAFEALEQAYRSGAFEATLVAKKAYYDVICLGARNAVVRDILDHLSTRINQLRSTSRSNAARRVESLAELKTLTRALFGRDRKIARLAAIQHIDAAANAASRNRGAAPERPRALPDATATASPPRRPH